MTVQRMKQLVAKMRYKTKTWYSDNNQILNLFFWLVEPTWLTSCLFYYLFSIKLYALFKLFFFYFFWFIYWTTVHIDCWNILFKKNTKPPSRIIITEIFYPALKCLQLDGLVVSTAPKICNQEINKHKFCLLLSLGIDLSHRFRNKKWSLF